MRNLYIFFLLSISQLLLGQNGFHLGGQVGYSLSQGPMEKYRGVQIGVNLKYQIKNLFIQSGYDHVTGAPNYGQYYSKELPNVPVYDIYDENYGLATYPTDDFSEVEVGVHQFDPSYGKYVARQFSLGLGYTIPIKIRKLNFKLSPSVLGLYRHVNENFVYGVKEIKVEDSFQSDTYVSVNHLIFAYLRYADLGYMFTFPVEMSLNKSTCITTSISLGKTFNGYFQMSVGLGIISKI